MNAIQNMLELQSTLNNATNGEIWLTGKTKEGREELRTLIKNKDAEPEEEPPQDDSTLDEKDSFLIYTHHFRPV